MTRTYACKRLLEHGGLTFSELVEITGWTAAQVSSTLDALMKSGVAIATGERMKYRYELT